MRAAWEARFVLPNQQGRSPQLGRRTKLYERVRPRDALYLLAIQPAELALQLLQVLVGQLLRVAAVGQREVAHVCLNEVVEYKRVALY